MIIPATSNRAPCVHVKDHHGWNLDPSDPIRVSYQKPFPGEGIYKNDPSALTMESSHGHMDAVINGIGRILSSNNGTGLDDGYKVLANETNDLANKYPGKTKEFGGPVEKDSAG